MNTYLFINGPNLNLLGKREPLLYGDTGFETYLDGLRTQFAEAELRYEQHTEEHALVNALHGALEQGMQGVVINPGAYAHTSIAVADAVAALRSTGMPVVEVHISNVFARELYRHHSYISKYASGLIVGFGLEGYRLALHYLISMDSGLSA